MQAWILEAVDAWLPAAAAQRLPVWLVIEELWRAQSPPRGPRPCPPFACVLRVLALAVVGLGELPTPQGANAQPELQVGFTQICGLCDDEFTVDVLGSQPFVLVNFFRAGPDLGLNRRTSFRGSGGSCGSGDSMRSCRGLPSTSRDGPYRSPERSVSQPRAPSPARPSMSSLSTVSAPRWSSMRRISGATACCSRRAKTAGTQRSRATMSEHVVSKRS